MSDENNFERELKDRLIDQALRERLGNDQPRDLTDNIIKRVSLEKPTRAVGERSNVRKYSGYEVPLAISIVLVVGLLTVPQLLKDRPDGGDRMLGLATIEEDDDATTDSLSAVELGSNLENDANDNRVPEYLLPDDNALEIDESKVSRLSVVDGFGLDKYDTKLEPWKDRIVNESLDTYNVPNHERTLSEKETLDFSVEEQRFLRNRLERELKATDRTENPPLDSFGDVRDFGIAESAPASPVNDDGLNRLADNPNDAPDQSTTNDWAETGGAMGGMGGGAMGGAMGGGMAGSPSGAGGYGAYGGLDAEEGKSREALFSSGEGEALSRLRNKKHKQLADDIMFEETRVTELASVPKNADRRYVRTEALGLERQFGRDQYALIHENPFFEAVGEQAISTFAIDVDTASYTNVRQYLIQSRRLPPPNAVRLEEMLNYFDYDYKGRMQTPNVPLRPTSK